MRISTIGRSGVAVGAIGILSIAVGGIGVATAANGGSLVLGHSNTTTHTTTLTDKKGPVLSLKTKSGKAPLLVSSDGLVKHLNANLLDGVTASTLSSGTTAQIKVNILEAFAGDNVKGVLLAGPTIEGSTPVLVPRVVLATKSLTAGTYQVNASFLAESAICWVGTTPAQGAQQYAVTEDLGGSINTSVKVSAGQEIHAYCAGLSEPGGDPEGSVLLSGGMNVTRVQTLVTGTAATPTPIATPTPTPTPTVTTTPSINPLIP